MPFQVFLLFYVFRCWAFFVLVCVLLLFCYSLVLPSPEARFSFIFLWFFVPLSYDGWSTSPPPQAAPADWPTAGQIAIAGLRAQYRQATPLILKDVTVTFRASENIGVVGRTGVPPLQLGVLGEGDPLFV